MRDSNPRESSADVPTMGVLGDAVWRLDQAFAKLEASLAALPTAPEEGLVDRVASQAAALEEAAIHRTGLEREVAALVAELETARGREMALMDAAAAASEALGRAGAEVRSALGMNLVLSEEEAA